MNEKTGNYKNIIAKLMRKRRNLRSSVEDIKLGMKNCLSSHEKNTN